MAGYDDMANLINMAGANIIGAANAAMSYGTHKADRKFNAKQAEIARDWQEKMWNQANEYNNPSAAMQRLTEAGLNPNLIYGNGADTTAASVPSTEKASYSGNIVPKLENIALMNQAKQLELLDAQIERTHAETSLTGEKATTQGIVNRYEDARLNAIVTTLSNDAEFNTATYNMRMQMANYQLDDARINNYMNNLRSMYLPEQLEQDLTKGYQSIRNMAAQENLTYAEIKKVASEVWFISEQVNYVRASAWERLQAGKEHIASATEHYAGAALKGEQAESERQLRDSREYVNWSSGYQNYASGNLSFESADRIAKMTPAELGKLTVDMNRSILEGNINWLKMANTRYGTGVVGAFMNSLNQGINGIGISDPMLNYRFNGYNQGSMPR